MNTPDKIGLSVIGACLVGIAVIVSLKLTSIDGVEASVFRLEKSSIVKHLQSDQPSTLKKRIMICQYVSYSGDGSEYHWIGPANSPLEGYQDVVACWQTDHATGLEYNQVMCPPGQCK